MQPPILYHYSNSTCSQKVRMVLAEKGVAFESREVNLLAGEQHAPEYVKLNPDHVVPTLVFDGAVLTESSLINEFIDDRFEGRPLRPSDPLLRYQAAALANYIDTRLHGKVTGVLTHAILTRGLLAGRTPEQVREYLAAIPNPADRALRESLLTHGVAAPEVVGAIDVLKLFFARLEDRLAAQPWFAGPDFGLADACALPYVARFRDMGLSAFWSEGARPRVAGWLDRCTGRPSFAEAFTAWTPPETAQLFARLGEAARPALETLIKG